ncbi:hypothetical protein D3C85_1190480 [compost metagenome]
MLVGPLALLQHCVLLAANGPYVFLLVRQYRLALANLYVALTQMGDVLAPIPHQLAQGFFSCPVLGRMCRQCFGFKAKQWVDCEVCCYSECFGRVLRASTRLVQLIASLSGRSGPSLAQFYFAIEFATRFIALSACRVSCTLPFGGIAFFQGKTVGVLVGGITLQRIHQLSGRRICQLRSLVRRNGLTLRALCPGEFSLRLIAGFAGVVEVGLSLA